MEHFRTISTAYFVFSVLSVLLPNNITDGQQDGINLVQTFWFDFSFFGQKHRNVLVKNFIDLVAI